MDTKKTKKPSNHIAMEPNEKFIVVLSYVVLTILCLLCLLPCLHVVSKAVSSHAAVTAGTVYFWPQGFQLEALKYVLLETDFLVALKNSVLVTVIGVACSMSITILFAYPLSKQQLKGRRFFLILCIIAMVFAGGMVPTYMVFRTLNLLNHRAALIVPHLCNIFNLFIIKNYFEGLPESVEESARIDGAGDFRILISIVCPMSKPVLATVSLLYAITYWNNYFDAMLYITDNALQTLQVYLKNVTNNVGLIADMLQRDSGMSISTDGLTACTVTLTLIPIILVYPFIQRFMVKGITIGSVKG